MSVVDATGNYTTAVAGTDYNKGSTYGDKKTILDFSAGFGGDQYGAYFSLRS
ncbi:MAG: hypothetical protein CM1200mP10_07850 [Candidatus Neomarinimicrobiota bacterium]|nr:MAG: hypothetical protein CM1200mP10_07850 [Candidatus Neomarinimicrobiota bacterium]